MTNQGPVWVRVDTCGECPRFEGSEWIRCTDREYAHMDGPPPTWCPLRVQEPEEITKLKAEVERLTVERDALCDEAWALMRKPCINCHAYAGDVGVTAEGLAYRCYECGTVTHRSKKKEEFVTLFKHAVCDE